MFNKKRKLGVITKFLLLLIFPIFLTGCSDDWVCDIPFVCSDSQVSDAAKTNNPDACDDLSYPDDPKKELSKKNQCFKKVAENSDNLDVCEKIADDSKLKDSCIKDIAVKLQDEVFCIDISDERKKEECYIGIGMANGDESLCAKSTTAANEKNCYTKAAEIKKDVSLCDSIKLENNRAECYSDVAILTEDIEICKNINFGFERNKISCINKLVIAKGDYNLCSEHRDNDLETNCVYDLALKTKDIGICLFVGNEVLSSQCIGEVAKSVGSVDACNDFLAMEEDNSWEICMTKVAVAKKDHNICLEIKSSDDYKVDCLAGVAEADGKYEVCDTLSGSDFDFCVLAASNKADDTSYCEKLGEGANKKYACVRNVALNTKNASVCVNELEGRDLDQCMGVVVQTHKNKRVCEFIEDPELEKQCLAHLK